MKKQIVLNNAPFFPGFYYSIYSSSDAFENAIELSKEDDENFDESKVDFDDNRYNETCAKLYCMALIDECVLPDFVESLEFLRVLSPKYYNYSTDKIECKITLADGWENEMRKFIAEHYDWLQDKITNDWTSCSGFISFIENDLEKWEKYLFEENDANYIEIMLSYMGIYELGRDIIRERLYYSVFENIYCPDFLIPVTENVE